MAAVRKTNYFTVALLALSFAIILFGVRSKLKNSSLPSINMPFKDFPIAPINSDIFEEKIGFPPIVKSSKSRDYDVFLFLTTAAPEYNCVSCKTMLVELSKAANLFSPHYRIESKVHFLSMELKTNQDLFMKLRIEHVPTLLYLPAHSKIPAKEYSKSVKVYDIRRGFDINLLLGFIHESSGKEPDVVSRNKGDNLLIFMGIFLFITTISFRYFRLGKGVVSLYQSSLSWSLLSLIFVILMLSGLMWTRIRNAPNYAMGRNGQPIYIAPGHQNQLGSETQILFTLNLLASLAALVITKSSNFNNKLVQKLVFWGSIAAICISFSIELNLFRQKIGGYPFHFLPISLF